MKNFSFKARMIYFGLIAIFSLGFFVLQLTTVMEGDAGFGSMMLLVLWGVMTVFAVAGIIASMVMNKRKE